ncbi:hypothetical protein SCP_0102040 [Sparassis crispa]|uniref:Uncharacterized protein n=1 Tax=Sparassis crispa TaxID=139825 RepID=A0A401G593_9APHY|nr:hypothetical protein SCP_0102040 [Sparassis crispa]GBE77331.1 hypothetical protein SCP_0102040 [Sparassis crispa]
MSAQREIAVQACEDDANGGGSDAERLRRSTSFTGTYLHMEEVTKRRVTAEE